MALTISSEGGLIDITFDGATDWDASLGTGLNKVPANGLKLKSIQFIPTATDDTLTIRQNSATGERLVKFLAADKYDSKIKYFNSDRLYDLHIVGAEASNGVIALIEVG